MIQTAGAGKVRVMRLDASQVYRQLPRVPAVPECQLHLTLKFPSHQLNSWFRTYSTVASRLNKTL